MNPEPLEKFLVQKEKKERNQKLKVRFSIEINTYIMQMSDCLSSNSPMMNNFSDSLVNRSYPKKTNPDTLIYDI